MEDRVRMDEQGRIYLPKELRERMKGRIFIVREEKGALILEPIDTVREGRGIFKVRNPIEEIDEKIEEYTKELVKDELH